MNFQYETEHLVFRIEHQTASKKVLEFYKKNRVYFDAWELTRPDNFYSDGYQVASLKIEYNESVKKHLVRFWLYEKEQYYENPTAAPIIGSVSVSDIRYGAFCHGMLGYKLDHDYWGRGLAKEACEKMIAIAFEELKLHRLQAFIMAQNERSVKLIERLGFHYEGTDRKAFEVNHVYEDHLRYALLREE